MNNKRFTRRFTPNPILSALFGSVALLSACGGSDDPAPAPPPAATTVDVATRVIDGPIQGATVCLDKNDNGACDAGEPSARTAADGSATLKVAPADAGKYPLLALVGTDAVDAATGPVTAAYSMRAPADQTALVSPLTTLVQAQMDLAGGTSAAADKAVQDAAGVAVSMFTDFTQGTDTAALGPIARLVVLAKQGASGALAAVTATPTKDSSGATITTADVDRAVDTRLLDLLPPMVSAVNSDAVTAATGAAKDDAIKAAAQALVTSQLALTAATLPVVIGTARTPDTSAPPTTPIAGASLAWFTYTDASNWYFRYFSSSAAQNTPDANGLQRFVDNRKRSIAGVVQVWGDPAYTRTDTYFNGSTWAVCPTSFENPNTVRDAQGRSESFYCGAYHGSSVRSVVDVAGQRMSEIVTQVRAYPLTNSQGSYPSWGPDPALLGAAVFPANSKLFYQTSTQISNPDAYTAR